MKTKFERKAANPMRRKLLKWTPPVITAVVLPTHAQTSVCESMPVLTATVAAKCSGSPLVSQAVITIFSDAADASEVELDILAVNFSGLGASDTFSVPSLPMSVIDTVGLDIEWSGEATDAVTCLPMSNITIDISYSCSSAPMEQVVSFNLTEVLAAAN